MQQITDTNVSILILRVTSMGCRKSIGATPTLDSASLYVKLRGFIDAALIQIARSNLEPLTFSCFFWLCIFFFLRLFLRTFLYFHQIFVKLLLNIFFKHRQDNAERLEDVAD